MINHIITTFIAAAASEFLERYHEFCEKMDYFDAGGVAAVFHDWVRDDRIPTAYKVAVQLDNDTITQ